MNLPSKRGRRGAGGYACALRDDSNQSQSMERLDSLVDRVKDESASSLTTEYLQHGAATREHQDQLSCFHQIAPI